MPSAPLIDFDVLNLDSVHATREEVRSCIMQRGRFEMLDGIAHLDIENALVVAFVDIHTGAWWASDHVPGRPLFPGALMIEASAQMCTYDFMQRMPDMRDTFVGFAGVDKVRYRGTVEPECRMYFAAKVTRIRRNMFTYSTQGFVERKLVYEGEIMGMVL
jgi:3-hydroxyacyl-[acyl-carrier-protein] dehydratase